MAGIRYTGGRGGGTPPMDQICNIASEDILWIHTILNPPGLDLRGEGELERAMGVWGGGLSVGTQVFTPPNRLTITCSRRERCSRPHDRAGWALLHWYKQGLTLLPILPACTWCGQPANSACDRCTTALDGSAHPLSRCQECASDELLRGCRACSGTPTAWNNPTDRWDGGEDQGARSGAPNASSCGRMCSLGPCIGQCNRNIAHRMKECCCEDHNMEIYAELLAGRMRDYITTAGVDTTGISNYDIGTTSTRILKRLADGIPRQVRTDT